MQNAAITIISPGGELHYCEQLNKKNPYIANQEERT